nr:TAF5-like RNA polymerase II p300/CBP-associated factor-associated factor 65 kDa subunit 5L [Leptinotarsa decemlineata]
MDDVKRENNRIKRSKSEVKTVTFYFQKRNYSASKIFESSRNQHLSYSSVGMYTCPTSGRSNSILFSCCNIDPGVIDHNFNTFLDWMKEQTIKRRRCRDIEQLVGPLFCHLYMDIFRGGHADRATAFYKCYLESVENKCDPVFKELIHLIGSDNDLKKYKENGKLKENFRNKKIVINISKESLAGLKKFVLENCHVIFLQVLQTWFDFNIITDYVKRDKEVVTVPSIEYPKDEKFQKLLGVINELKKESTPIFNIKIHFSQLDIACGLLKRQCELVAFAEKNKVYLMPVHPLNSLFDLDDDNRQVVLTNHSGQIYCMDMSPMNDMLVSGSGDGTICIYDLVNMTLVRKCVGHLGPVYCVKVSGNGEFLVSGSMDGTARLWQLRNGNILRIFSGHTQSVTCVDFHPNCLYVATGSTDKNIRLWCINKSSSLRLLHFSKGTIFSLAFSPCGKKLASACEDKKIRVWDILTAKVTVELRCKDFPILKLLWNEAGNEICAGTVNGVIRVWNCSKTQENCEVNKPLEPVLTQSVHARLLCIEYTFGTYSVLTAS